MQQNCTSQASAYNKIVIKEINKNLVTSHWDAICWAMHSALFLQCKHMLVPKILAQIFSSPFQPIK